MNLLKGDPCGFSQFVSLVHMLRGHVPFQISMYESTEGGSRHVVYGALPSAEFACCLS